VIEVYSVVYTVEELKAVPKRERTFFLAMTGLANDVQTLNKQLIMARDFKDENRIVQQGAHSVAMLNARMLAGRMYEGWKNIADHYPKISDIYDARLSQKAAQARQSLTQYFKPVPAVGEVKSPPSLLEMVRHKFGFHSELGIISKNFDAFPNDAEMGEYICRTMGNTLYFSAELIHLQILSGLCGRPEDPIAALDRLITEAMEVTRWVNDFAFGFVHAFLTLHFDNKLKAIPENLEQIHDQPNFKDLKIPYFVEHFGRDESKRAPKAP
jgi:hypothetical protein